MNFIVSLPAYEGYIVIVDVVAQFSKAPHFGISPTHFLACKAAKTLTQMIFKLHEYPKSIISEKDPILVSKF